ncbi:MAG: malto-oligosyltrehalose trehalohydrolase [Nitrospirales bacterium]|nr:malto-oligosyltrehalose trehalohydrolase [Nitrospira sp.]MDR4499895.1 malto-oligosyltrehalose trehalohydrolase [Nitrospirales bacterium]
MSPPNTRTQNSIVDRPFDIGPRFLDSSTVEFRMWAPWAHSMAVHFPETSDAPTPLSAQPFGYWTTTVSNVSAGTRYRYLLNEEKDRPDPVSRFQPEGVHGPSELVDTHAFAWTDQRWTGRPLKEFIIYELHVGTFTQEGTFEAIIPFLPYLRDEIGITAIELMPVAQFPGKRNWGYDGTYLFAPQNSYGGPQGLHRLVDACHAADLAVILDVVYNHFGPEGNYWGDFGPLFTDHYRTPWGNAVNYDGPDSDSVRATIIDNARYWVRDYHIDALRLDAIHSIFDFSTKHVLQELTEAVRQEAKRHGRSAYIIAESDLNDTKIIAAPSKGGYGLDGQWNDDFHHALHALVTKEQQGYYCDFGALEDIATAWKKHFVLSGQYSRHRHRRHGHSASHLSAASFVVFAQNHDQIGNRAQGDRLSTLVPHSAQQVLIASVLLSPFLPLMFMGEEYGEQAPFQYFIDHGDEHLIDAVRKGRLSEFKKFGWKKVPDPYDAKTFEASRLTLKSEHSELQRRMAAWVTRLITLRKQHPSLGPGVKGHQLKVWTHKKQNVLMMYRKHLNAPAMLLILGFNDMPQTFTIAKPQDKWRLLLNNHTEAFSTDIESPSPTELDLTKEKQQLSLPAYPVRVYQQT